MKLLTIKQINFTDTFLLRQSVMSPDKQVQDMKRPSDEEAIHLGAYLESKLVGISSFYEDPPRVWRIRGMAVDKEYQNRGIGAKIIEHALKTFLKDQDKIWCNSRQKAVSFYEKLGFVQQKVVPTDDGYGDRVLMIYNPRNNP